MPRELRRQSGSVLMLFPAAVLVVLILGAIAVDASVAFLAKRELNDASAALANDLAIEALSNDAFYHSPDRAPRLELDTEYMIVVGIPSILLGGIPNKWKLYGSLPRMQRAPPVDAGNWQPL